MTLNSLLRYEHLIIRKEEIFLFVLGMGAKDGDIEVVEYNNISKIKSLTLSKCYLSCQSHQHQTYRMRTNADSHWIDGGD